VSPAGGNFEEPVTQSTLKVVGAFHGLSRERSDARRFPAIHPLESWSKYEGVINRDDGRVRPQTAARGNEVNQMMKVVGEEGTSMMDFVTYLKGEYLDAVYLQQDAFDEVDSATPARPAGVRVRPHPEDLEDAMRFSEKDEARQFLPAPDPDDQGLEPDRTRTRRNLNRPRTHENPSRRSLTMRKVYTKIEQIAGNVIVVKAAASATANSPR
jgi:hypothetical protein